MDLKKHYRAVFIDWDDTLGDWAGVAKQSQEELYARYHLDTLFASSDAWREAYNTHNTALWERYGRGEITKDYLYIDHFLYPICMAQGVDSSAAPAALREQAQRMADDYVELTNRYSRLVPDVADTVRYLAERYPLTVVSNGFVECQHYKMAQSGLRDCFRHVVLSEEVGIPKPRPGIFEIALAQNRAELPDLRREEVVMIGDSYMSDIAGAKAAGIDSIWVLRGEATEAQRQDATYIVPNLRSVRSLL